MTSNARWVGGALLAYCAVFLVQVACTRPKPRPIVLAPVEPSEAFTDMRERGDAGVRLGIPFEPEPFQKTPPCDAEMDEHEIRGACYQGTGRLPPCGKLREYKGRCFRPLAKSPRQPTSIHP